tara:strand:- start:431 stop:1414 length:984 start_codon:yes stop_codon:yes gene_type:complete
MMGHYNNILCVITSISEQQALVEQALHVADSHQASLTLHLALESLPPNASLVMASFAYIDSQQSLKEEAGQRLQAMADKLNATERPATLVTVGKPYYDVIQQVMHAKHDLVISQARSGMSGFLFGADAMHLLRKCPCPVWLIHRETARNYKTVMAAVDVNYHYTRAENQTRRQLNEAVMVSAAEIALLENARLHIVHVYDAAPRHMLRDGLMRSHQQQMDNALAELKKERSEELARLVASLEQKFDQQSLGYLQPEVHLADGHPAEGLCRMAESLPADVVVMGTVARVGVPGLLMGNTAEDVLNNLDCAVLALKPEGFESIVPQEDN